MNLQSALSCPAYRLFSHVLHVMSGGEEWTVCNFTGIIHWTGLQCQRGINVSGERKDMAPFEFV